MKNLENYNPILFVTVVTTKKHLLGIRNPDVGIFYGTGFDEKWVHLGWGNGRVSSVTIDEKSNGKIIYAACGNGVLKSIDFGRTWKIITGCDITEVLKVGIEPSNSNIIYACSAYGIFKSLNGGKTWQEKNRGKKTRYCSKILFDKANHKKILIACEDGIYVSTNKAESWSLFALKDKGIRCISQNEIDFNIFAVGTEDDGIFISIDGGKSFNQKTNGLDHHTIYSIAMDPKDRNNIYCGTYEGGIYKTRDCGYNWRQINNGLSELNIHALAVHPKNNNVIFAGTINGGLFRSNDAGNSWMDISGETLDKAQVWDLQFYKEKLFHTNPVKIILNRKYSQFKYDSEYRSRREKVFEFLSENFESSGIYSALSKIILGKNIEKAYQELDDIIDSGKVGHMFLAHQLMTAYLHCRKYLPQRLTEKIRNCFKTRNFYRGDTENHYLLYYSSLYLAAQTWKDLDGNEWFNGKSSKENFQEAKQWIDFWMKTTTTIGQGEFDSPTYHPTFLAPLLLLYDFAKDPKMKKRSQIMIDYQLADFAVEHLKGFYCGGHSRDYPTPPNITNPGTAPITAWAHLLFGQNPFPYEARDFGLLFLPIMSSYQLPEIIYRIGTDREEPYVHTETKRVRNIFRFSEVMNPPVYKYIYMTKNYALGSLHGGGVLQPIQQHTWDVTYISDKPYNTIFSLHPYNSPKELGMFFPDEMKLMVDEVHKYHKIYKSSDKWAGASQYEQTFQHKNAIIVLYNIKKGELFEEIDAHFPKNLDERICHETGWILCKAGKTFIAYYPIKPYEWIEEDTCYRLRSRYLKNGCVLEVASDEDFLGDDPFKAFMEKILLNKVDISNFDETLTVKYTTRNNDVLEFTYDGERILNGKAINFKDYKLFNGPYLYAKVGSQKLKLTYKNKTRLLDLKKARIV